MQSSDRADFETELEKLCAAFGVPATKARQRAFWEGLARMSLPQFRRCVEIAIGENGPDDDQPTTKLIWRIHRGGGGPAAKPAAAIPDHLEFFANRLLWLHVSHRGGLGSVGRFEAPHGLIQCRPTDELQACLRVNRELVAEFVGYVREGDTDATPATFVQYWISGIRRVSTLQQRTIDDLTTSSEAAWAQKPFEASMARELRSDAVAA